MKEIKFSFCSWLLTSVVLCLVSFLSSHSSRFLAKCKGNGVGKGCSLFSSDDRAAAATRRNSSVVTHRRYASNRQPVKENVLKLHTEVWFSMSFSAYFNASLGQGNSWVRAVVTAEKQNEVRGCWCEISAPSVKIRITSSDIHHPHLWIWKSSISNTVCTGFHGCFAQALCI